MKEGSMAEGRNASTSTPSSLAYNSATGGRVEGQKGARWISLWPNRNEGNNVKTSKGVRMRMKKSLGLLLAVGLALGSLTGQGSEVERLKQEIAFYADVLVNADAEVHRSRAHEALAKAMDALISLPGSYDFNLDSVHWISVLHGDGFRIVTWQWRVTDEEYKYEGFIQLPDKVISLRDTRPFLNGSGYNTYTPGAWYGALYYELYPFERDGKPYYILLGFNAENSRLNTKVADILDMNGQEPTFGMPFFEGKGEPMTRLLLTYADISAAHIRYDSAIQTLVQDHVESLIGIGPDGETLPVSDGSLEGWELKKGHWMYVEEMYDIQSDVPPMTDERKDRKEDKDILGRPRKQ